MRVRVLLRLAGLGLLLAMAACGSSDDPAEGDPGGPILTNGTIAVSQSVTRTERCRELSSRAFALEVGADYVGVIDGGRLELRARFLPVGQQGTDVSIAIPSDTVTFDEDSFLAFACIAPPDGTTGAGIEFWVVSPLGLDSNHIQDNLF